MGGGAFLFSKGCLFGGGAAVVMQGAGRGVVSTAMMDWAVSKGVESRRKARGDRRRGGGSGCGFEHDVGAVKCKEGFWLGW